MQQQDLEEMYWKNLFVTAFHLTMLHTSCFGIYFMWISVFQFEWFGVALASAWAAVLVLIYTHSRTLADAELAAAKQHVENLKLIGRGPVDIQQHIKSSDQ